MGRPPSGIDAPALVVAMRGCRRLVASAARTPEVLSIGRFPNGELHAGADPIVAGRRCTVVGSVSPPEGNLAAFTLAAHTLRRAGADSVTAVIPYLAYARQDRAPAEQSLGLAWVGELLRAAGVGGVVTVDVHSEVAGSLLQLPLTSLEPATALAAALPSGWRADDVTVVAPDRGAGARCNAFAVAAGLRRPVAVVEKRRMATSIEHVGVVGELTRRAVVVDDILDTGATLVSCCRRLAALGVEEIAVAVTHALLTGDAWRELWETPVRHVWATDTVAHRGRRAAGIARVPIRPLLEPHLGLSA